MMSLMFLLAFPASFKCLSTLFMLVLCSLSSIVISSVFCSRSFTSSWACSTVSMISPLLK